MLVPKTSSQFLDLVRKSGLVDAARISELYPSESSLPTDPKACALGLVKSGVLTQYQAKMLVNGKSRGFFVGPYVIEGPIGQGGMGIVYRARHTSLGRHVALKILPSNQASDQLTLNRFLREARAAAALDHPNIVRLYDIGQGSGVHFLVMEYVDGENVQAILEKSGALDYRLAVDYVAQAAAGLKHAHERGIVHRDIKPANLMVTKDGKIKILDMGLARSLRDEKDNLTALHGTGEVTGTADYISPEHLLGEQVDGRSDLYSLGATLFSLLLGRPPYVGTTTQKLVQHQLKDAAELRSDLRGKIPAGLTDVVVKMMAKRKTERYQSANEVIEALAPWLPAARSGKAAGGQPATRNLRGPAAKPSGSSARRRKGERKMSLPAGRKKWMLIGGAVGFVALVGGLALALGNGGKNTATAQPPGANAPVPQVPPTWGLPGVLNPPPALPLADPQALRAHTSGINDMVFGRDGLLCAVDWSGHLIIWDPKEGRPARSFAVRPGSKLNACVTTPDGRQVIVVGEKIPVVVLDWETGQLVRELPGHAGTTWGVAVSPTGREVLTCGTDSLVLLRDLLTGDEIRRFQFEARQIWGVAFSADGSRIAACGAKGPSQNESYLIRVWETATGRELHKLTGHTADVRWVTFSPDGQTLASAGFDGTVRLWDLKPGSETRTIVAHNGYTERVFFLPGGQRLVSCGGPLSNKDPGEGGSIKVWDAQTGHEVRAWRGAATTDLIALALSADGTQVATGSRDKIVRIWPLSAARGN